MAKASSGDERVTDRLFSPKSLNVITNIHGIGRTKLVETSCPDSIVDISGIPDGVRILVVARFPQTERFFAGQRLGCRGDFSIIDVKHRLIVHLEIKRAHKSGIKEQLLGSSALIPYFRALASKMLLENHYLENYEERFVSVGYSSIDMRNSSGRKVTGTGTSADDIKRINYPGVLQYRNLI